MSDEGEPLTSFNCYFGGKFEQHEDSEYYVGGDFKLIETVPEQLFASLLNDLPVSLYGQRVWYKLPFEGVEDRRLLHNGDPNFVKMCTAAIWTKVIDVYLDVDDEEADEEVRVERHVAHFVDEEFNEYDTGVGSDNEEDECMRDGYFKYKKGSGELRLRQAFDSLEEFKKAMVDYVLKEGWNVKYVRWEKDKSELKCASEGDEKCRWKIYCSYEKPLQKWMVKTYENEHSCIKSGYSKIVSQEVIARLFVNDLRDNPMLMPKGIQEQIHIRWDLIASIDQCRHAKGIALKMIKKEYDEQFSRLRDYRLELLESNQDSTVVLETVTGDEGSDIFFRFYVCFEALRRTWCEYARPIFGLDGCFLKCSTRGQLLAAVGRDANDQMLPLAWAIVDVEDEDNWKWFIEKLQSDLNLGDGDGFTVISDRQKGLLNAVAEILQNIEHRMCARHIYANLKKKFPHRADMKGFFWKVAKSYNMAEYNKRLEAVRQYDTNVFDAMMLKNPKNCSLAFFTPMSSCVDVSNNISESFNHAIEPARGMPVITMLEIIRRRAMVRIDVRKNKAEKHKGKFTINSMKKVVVEQEKIKFCKAFPSGPGVFEVKVKNSAFHVDMGKHSCTCRKWDMSGLPCRHALKVISNKKLNPENFMADCYLTSRWRKQYSSPILPVRGINFWNKMDEPGIVPPPVTEGTRKNTKRIKERHESPSKKKKRRDMEECQKKVSREKRIMHCGNCGGTGHNRRKCNNVEGPSQQQQSQVIDP